MTKPSIVREPLPSADLATTRLESLSDNIFAVAMTILILNVRIPTPTEVGSASNLWPHVAALWHHLRTFAISFLIVGSFWEIHHRIFMHVTGVDRTLTWLNLIWIGFVVLIPFSAALLGNFDENAAAIAIWRESARRTEHRAIALVVRHQKDAVFEK